MMMAANQVSGPGPQAKRTDIGDVQKTRDLPNADYGEQQQYQAQQAGAPLAADQGGQQNFGGMDAAHQAALQQITPLSAPTQRPGEPVTAGAASGPGPNSMGLPNMPQQDMQQLQAYLPVFQFMAGQQGSSWALRNLVRQIKAAPSG
jgi:hypothetical protein